jgi:dephospho-CoA kinase
MPFPPLPARGEIAMLRMGLTGGIASGKSAVAAMLREMGFAVLDADSLAHTLIEPGQPA